MKKQKKDINDFFNDIRDGQIDANELTIRVSSMTNDFALEKTETLRKDFDKYFKREQEIRNSVLSLEEKIQISNIYADNKDPHFSFCFKFEAFLKSIVARASVGEKIEYESELFTNHEVDDKNLDTFSKIFKVKDWNIYIDVLIQVRPPLLDEKYNFIGKQRKDKGVICSWIKTLQDNGKIHRDLTRQQLSIVLNKEIKDFNLGVDGKTFDVVSKYYQANYEDLLKKLSKLLP